MDIINITFYDIKTSVNAKWFYAFDRDSSVITINLLLEDLGAIILQQRFYILINCYEDMPEQQKIDETIESTKRLNKKKLSKIEQSSTSLENQQNPVVETGSDDDTKSILETQDDELKEWSNNSQVKFPN